MNTRTECASTSCAGSNRIATASWTKSCRGTKGSARILANVIEGENAWRFDQKAGKDIDMYDLEHVALFNSIREGKPINNGHYMANSTMLAIMGRMCTYTGQTLTWDECMQQPGTTRPERIRLAR